MKKLLVLTALSLITMQGFTAWGKLVFVDENDTNTYKMGMWEFDICFNAEMKDTQPYYIDYDNCLSHLKAITDTFKNGGILLVDKGPESFERAICSKNQFKKEIGLPKDDELAEAITGCYDCFVDKSNPQKRIDYEDCKQCTASMIAKYKEKQSERSYLEFKNEINGWLYFLSTKSKDKEKKDIERLRRLKKKYEIRQKFCEKLETKRKNQCGENNTEKQ